jgi:dTDP-4-amino-4,6-dideoxygalactose transaminase
VFVIRSNARDNLQIFLKERGIQTLIHYPIPPHMQKAYTEYAGMRFPITEKIHKEVLSLPISPIIREDDIEVVISALNDWEFGT